MTTQTYTANERMALLLGWEPRTWKTLGGAERAGWVNDTYKEFFKRHRPNAPDYTTWERFPEMQEYVGGLDLFPVVKRISQAIWQEMSHDRTPELGTDIWVYITPTILRDAILVDG